MKRCEMGWSMWHEISYSIAKTSDVCKQRAAVQLVEEIRDCSWQWAVFLCRELTPYSLFVPELRVSCLLGLSRPAAAAKHHVFITSNLLAQESQSAWNVCVSNAILKMHLVHIWPFVFHLLQLALKALFWKLFKLYIPSILMY